MVVGPKTMEIGFIPRKVNTCVVVIGEMGDAGGRRVVWD